MKKKKQPANFASVAQEFEQAMQVKNWSPATIRAYIFNLCDYFAFLKLKGVSDARRADAKLLREYHAHIQGELGNKFWSICMRVRAVKRFCEWLHESQATASNPSASLREPKIKDRLPRTVLNEKEALRMLEAPNLQSPEGLLDRALMEVLYGSGLRVAELVALDLEDADLGQGMVRVKQGKGKKERLVPMTAPALRLVTKYLAQARKALTKFQKNPCLALWLNRSGKRLSPVVIARRLRRYADQVGIKKSVSPHIWRHSFATALVRHGANIRHVQEMLGHAQATNSSIYFRVAGVEVKKAHEQSHPRGGRMFEDPSPHIEALR